MSDTLHRTLPSRYFTDADVFRAEMERFYFGRWICAGRENNFSLDDAYCAGRLVLAALGGRRMRRGLNDAALGAMDLVRRYGERWERALSASRAGRDLTRLGLRDDLLDAARKDAYPVLAQYHDRRVTVLAGAAA